jgi:hypothetical protein
MKLILNVTINPEFHNIFALPNPSSSSAPSVSVLGRFFAGSTSTSISSSEGFRSSSRSHTGLGGRFCACPSRDAPCVIGGAGGATRCAGGGRTGDGTKSAGDGKSSTSHGGLSSRTGGAFSFPFPLSLAAPDPIPTSPSADLAHAANSSSSLSPTDVAGGRCDEGSLSKAVREEVAAVRNGRSNASLIRRTLTWPNPGREESLSDEAVAIFAKLWSGG